MTASVSDFETVVRLLLAAVLGAAIGFEREYRQKSAGLRTNTLISIGAALFTLMSIELAEGVIGADPSRIAAQIVTGIGFLGAGAIIRHGGNVLGLTTAATVWVNAAVGVAAGGGRYVLAVSATVVTILVLSALVPLERSLDRKPRKAID